MASVETTPARNAEAAVTPAGTNNLDRPIEGVYHGPGVHWVGDGFRVRGYFAAYPALVKKLSPFLLFDYAEPHEFPATQNLRRGVGPHPHRGFETVTIAFEGSVAHHDSAGGGGVIGPGDVQWMTAGGGLLHREYHAEPFARSGGTMHMMQIWVNLPKAHKLTPPAYQALSSERMGIARLPNGAGLVRVIAGEYLGTKGPANTFTPIDMFDVQLDSGGSFEFTSPASRNLTVLVMKGVVTVQGNTPAREADLIVFENQGERVRVQANGDARILVLGGEPIHEPVVQHGPFVMNTVHEIRQAIEDFQTGKFGHLDD